MFSDFSGCSLICLSGVLPGFHSGVFSGVLSSVLSGVLAGVLSGFLAPDDLSSVIFGALSVLSELCQ